MLPATFLTSTAESKPNFLTSTARELRKGCTFAAFLLNGTLRGSCASV